jgi:hypothetical protein
MADVTDSLVCPVCNSKCLDEEMSLLCDGYCGTWHHAKCVNISVKNFNDIRKIEQLISWFCSDCDNKLKNHLAQTSVEKNLKDDFDKMQVNVIKALAALEKKINLIVNQGLKTKIVLNKLCNQSNELDFNQTRADMSDRFESSVCINEVGTPNKKQVLPSVAEIKVAVQTPSPNVPTGSGTVDLPTEPNEDVRENGNEILSNATCSRSGGLLTNVPTGSGTVDLPTEPNEDVRENGNEILSNSNATCSRSGGLLVSERNSIEPHKPTYSDVLKDSHSLRSIESRPKVIKSINDQRKSGVVIGTSQALNNLKSATRRSHFFVSRVSPEITSDDVLSYLSTKGLTDNECVVLNSRFNTYKSFKVGVPSNYESAILDPSFWPKGVLVRHFLPSQRSPRPAQNSFLGRTIYRTQRT